MADCTALDNRLTSREKDNLEAKEKIIEKGINTFVEVGHALLVIRDRRLYRASYDTFEDYCWQKWLIGKSRDQQLIGAYQIVVNVSTVVDTTPN